VQGTTDEKVFAIAHRFNNIEVGDNIDVAEQQHSQQNKNERQQ
jgi:hypothetical protein